MSNDRQNRGFMGMVDDSTGGGGVDAIDELDISIHDVLPPRQYRQLRKNLQIHPVTSKPKAKPANISSTNSVISNRSGNLKRSQSITNKTTVVKHPTVPLYNQKDIVSDYKSVNQYKSAGVSRRVHLVATPEMKEEQTRRMDRFNRMLDPNYDQVLFDEANREQTARREQAISEQEQHANFSDNLIKLKCNSYIPTHIQRINIAKFYGEVGVKTSLNANEIYEFKPKDPQITFGSLTDYMQGDYLPPSNEGFMGDLKNIYMFEYDMVYVRSDFPVALAVLVGENIGKDSTGKAAFVPYEGAGCSVNSDYYLHNKKVDRVHAIIPPKFDHAVNRFRLFRSTIDINDPFGAQFPFLIPDAASIRAGCIEMPNNQIMVPKLNPTIRWIWDNAHLYDWAEETLPDLCKEEGHEDYTICSLTMFETAEMEVLNQARKNIPVKNFNNVVLKFFPLSSGPAAKINIDKELFSLLTPHDETVTAFSSQINNKGYFSASRDKIKESYGISFQCEVVFAFRDVIDTSPSLEDDEDNDSLNDM